METITFFFEKPLNRFGMYLMSKETFEMMSDGVVEMLDSSSGVTVKTQRHDPHLANNFRKFLTGVIYRPVVLPGLGEFVKFEK